ncbi:MAG: YdbH domain-containing protein [Candidatus Thiodiazotropha sp. (ex Monitilora ramsayi)]|nr:YdbH domain-containing protein [Candidatus Thiodiazotropha sp. (ex Monitilora ramsayi)]
MSFPEFQLFQRAVVVVAGFSLLLFLKFAGAIDQFNLNIGTISSSVWRVERLRFALDWGSLTDAGYRLEIGRLELSTLKQSFDNVKVECRRGELNDRFVSCHEGEVQLSHPLLDRDAMTLSFELDRDRNILTGKLQGISIADGRVDLNFSLDAGNWRLGVQGKSLQLETLLAQWPQGRRYLVDWHPTARLNLGAQLSGRDDRLNSVKWKGELTGLSFGDDLGAYIGEGLAIRQTGRLSNAKKNWQIETTLTLTQGELLTPAFYLDAAAHPIELEGSLLLGRSFETLALRDGHLQQQELMDLRFEGDLRLSADQPLEQLKLQTQPFQAGDVYRELLQPVWAGTSWGRFEMAGEIDLSLHLMGQALSLDLGLNNFSLDDTQVEGTPRRLGLYDVNGELKWNRGSEVRSSRLEWQAGHLLERVDIGPGKIDFLAFNDTFRLTRQIRVPVLDGFLVVDRLSLEALGMPSEKLQFDGFLEPISMDALSKALGWVPLSGKLSGVIPGLTYENGLFTVDGILLMRIFDGEVQIENLRTRDLFGVYPQLQADVELRDLDLDSLTSTFSFGKITGRLDGYVHDLSLENWQPVTFDARFYTPEDDDSRRRISQKAVDNISNLGGAGLSGSLARSFMGLFETFRYKRIGIGCRLSQGVCDMVGAGEAKQGYYLVEGSGIPRIDIIGYNRTADWPRLVEQLKQITTSEGPRIE